MPARLELPAILIAVLLAFALVQPYGNFPLDDDENHAIGTWNFVHLHRFQFAIDTTPPLRAQVLWGALWTVLFGESFNVLRASTMFLGLLTLILVHRTLLLAGLAPGPRVLATLAFLFHPLFFWSTHTFMTETPFVFASALALFCFFRALTSESLPWFLGGCAAVVVSWWIRQGIINLFPPVLVLAVFRDRITTRWKAMLTIAGALAAAYAVMALTRPDLIVASPQEFHQHYKFWGEATFRAPEAAAHVLSYLFFNIQNVTLFFLPLALGAVLVRPQLSARWQKITLGVLLLLLGGRATQLIVRDNPIPYYNWPGCCGVSWGNVLMNFGLGPPTVTDVWTGIHPYPWQLPHAARIALMIVTVLVAIAAMLRIATALREASRVPRTNVLFLLSAASVAFGTITLVVSVEYIDRYALDTGWPAVFLLAPLLQWERARVRVAAIVATGVFAVFSVLATQEYFAWNRARWAAWWELRERGVAIRQIDGGAEPYLYYELSQAKTFSERRRMAFGVGKRPYVLAFAPLPGTRVIARHPFRGWLGWHRGEIVTLERISGSGG